jgi:hypothetical protein
MLTHTTLQKFSLTNPPFFALQREKEVQKKYDIVMKDKGRMVNFLEDVKRELETEKFYLVENDFPYSVEKGIKHLVCWYNDCDPYIIQKELQTRFEVITCWKNKPANCSISEVSHIHVFIHG